MKSFKPFVSFILCVLAFNSLGQSKGGLDATIFGHDLGWIKLNNAAGLNIMVSDQVSDGCWTNIAAVQNAVELQLIRSGYETYTGDAQVAFAPAIWIKALGFGVTALNGCAVAVELSVRVSQYDSLDWEEGSLNSIHSYQLASYAGIFTARKSDSNESIRKQFEALTQSMLVEVQKSKQGILKALKDREETAGTKYWIEQLE